MEFLRPKWMINLNLVAALLFGVLGSLYLWGAKTMFGIAWLAIGALWIRRFAWARKVPFIEVTETALVAHLGPGRQRELPLAEVRAVEEDPARVELALADDSSLSFSKNDFRAGDMARFAARLRSAAGG